MKAQQVIAVVKKATATAPHPLKALSHGVLGVIFLGLTAVVLGGATLDTLVNAAGRFSAAIQEQLATVQNGPTPADFAEKTLAYAEAKTAYITTLREEMPELINIATGEEPRPVQLDRFAAAFSIAGERQEKEADKKMLTLLKLKRFSGDPHVEHVRAEFERTQEIEEAFHKDFDGIDLSSKEL